MRISTPLQYSGDVVAAADQVATLEKAGLDVVWIAEAYGYDAVSLMGYLAAKTETVQIGSGILNIFGRTPAMLAQTAAGLDAVSGGRCILGLGASGPQVIEGWHGVPYDRPVARTREIIELVRRMLRREVIEHDGIYTVPLPAGEGTGLGKPLKMLTTPLRSDVPIHIAALGPKNVELAAEVADGWMPTLFAPEKANDVWGDALARGKAKRSPDLPPLDVVSGALVAIAEGEMKTTMLDLTRPMIALYVGGMGAKGRNFYNTLFCSYGWGEAAATIQELYLSGKKQEAAAAIPAEALEMINLVGSASQIKERLSAFEEAGVTTLNIIPADADPASLIHKLKTWTS